MTDALAELVQQSVKYKAHEREHVGKLDSACEYCTNLGRIIKDSTGMAKVAPSGAYKDREDELRCRSCGSSCDVADNKLSCERGCFSEEWKE